MSSRIKYIFLLVILHYTLAFSFEFPKDQTKGILNNFSVNKEQEASCCQPCLECAYNFPGRIEVQSDWDISLSAGYIFWQAIEQGNL